MADRMSDRQWRWAANAARRKCLTFNTKGEIIIFLGRNSGFARALDSVIAVLARLFFHHRKLPSSHSEF
jgi:hypothetical protein